MKEILDHSVNVIAYEKNDKKYAMCAAWCMNVDYDKLMCLLGSQSVTGNNIKKGDIVGFSSLRIKQKNIAERIGSNHSNIFNKLDGIDYKLDEGAILISNAKTMSKCEVIDVLHPKGIEVDNLLYLRIISTDFCDDDEFLHMSDF